MKTSTFLFSTYLATCLLALAVCSAQAGKSDFSTESKMMAAEYRDKGLAAQKTGDLDTAQAYFQKAVEIDPSMAVAYNDLGVIYEARGWNDRAKVAYGKAVDLDPSLASPYYNLGSIYEKEGDYDRAIEYLKKRVSVGEWNEAYTQKARQELRSLGVDDPELKQEFLENHLARVESLNDVRGTPKGNDLDPRSRKREARFHLLRGRELYYMGMYQEALKEIGLAEVLDPRSKEIQKTLEEVQRKALFTQ
jgi:tetratricopeptide (TPR) repeat protein